MLERLHRQRLVLNLIEWQTTRAGAACLFAHRRQVQFCLAGIRTPDLQGLRDDLAVYNVEIPGEARPTRKLDVEIG